MKPALTWVVGSGGLLGSSVARQLAMTDTLWTPSERIPWGTPRAALTLFQAAEQFALEAGTHRWQLAWCAGVGVTGTARRDLDAEVDLFRTTLDALGGAARGSGSVFLASSAGGVYAGAREAPPFTEVTPPRPVSPYGEAKMEAERAAAAWARRTGFPVAVGRIANLYGPGQSLQKPQGLISQLCRTYLTGQPLSLYVPLDTVRDYLYVDDCAALVAQVLVAARELPPGTAATKILASQRAVTVGALLGEFRRLLRRPPRVVLATSPATRYQALDLRLKSVTWPAMDRRTLTPLPVGISATMESLRTALRAGHTLRSAG